MGDDDHDERHRGPAHSSPYPLSRLAPSFSLVDVARTIEEADAVLGHVASSKLELIAEQIKTLQEQARGVLRDMQRDAELHRAECRLVKRPGAVYHLYARENGTLYLSLLSPADWGGSPPHLHRGAYRLEVDHSFTAID